MAYSYVTDKTAHDKLFNDLAPRYKYFPIVHSLHFTQIETDSVATLESSVTATEEVIMQRCVLSSTSIGIWFRTWLQAVYSPGELRQPRPAAPPSPAKSNYHYDGIKMLFEEDVPQNTLVSKTKGAHAQEPVEEAGEPKQHKEKHHKGDKSDPAKEAKDDKHKAEKSKEEKPKEEKPKEEKHEAKKESKEHEKPKK